MAERNHGERIESAGWRRPSGFEFPAHWPRTTVRVLAVAANFMPAGSLPRHAGRVPGNRMKPSCWRRSLPCGTSWACQLVLKIVFALAMVCVDVRRCRILPKGLYGGYEGHADEVDCHEEHEEHSKDFWRHCVTRWKFLCSSWCSALHWADSACRGRSAAAFLGSLGIFQPMMAALIWSCTQLRHASVPLAQLYMGGAITFWQFFCGVVLRRRYRPGCAVACQPPS